MLPPERDIGEVGFSRCFATIFFRFYHMIRYAEGMFSAMMRYAFS